MLLVVWAVTVGLALKLRIDDIRAQSLLVATEGARNMFRMVVLTRKWNAGHGGVYVPVTPENQPNPYLEHPNRDVVTRDGVQMTLVNPAYMTRLIAERSELESGAVFRLTSLKTIRPQNAPDEWESVALLSFDKGSKEMIGIVASEKGKQLRFMAPLMVEKACLQCHAKLGYKIGDIRGGVSVSQRYEPIELAIQISIRQSMMSFGGIFFIVAVVGWGLLELLRRRWHDLAGKIRELEETREELVQSEKLASLGRMVAGFAHEINTPVGVAVGAVSYSAETLDRIDKMLANEEVDEHELRAELDELRHGGTLALSNLTRAANLVQSFKRTSIDQASEQVRDFAVKELINDVLFSLHNVLKRLPLNIEVSCPDDLHLDGIPGLLNQVLNNLVMNAVQHAFEDVTRQGTIVIDVFVEDGHVRIVFADDGIGMTSDQLARIFEPFYTTKRGNGGSGLGLYICYEIVTVRLGGTINCESEPGAGCRFVIDFPAQFAEQRDTQP